jgi:hypothetical protein
MLFVEQPVGVGFSYSDDNADYATGDAEAAADLYQTALAFFAKYAQYQGNDFYLTSESYGGHYLPTTAAYILAKPGAAAALNFKGFFLGNPWTDPASNALGRVQTLYGHGAIPKPDYDAWAAACVGAAGQAVSAACAAASAKVLHESTWDGQNEYALSYPACHAVAQEGSNSSGSGGTAGGWGPAAAAAGAVAQRRWLWAQGGLGAGRASDASTTSPDLVYDPCVDNYGLLYLNRLDVQTALHVNASSAQKGNSSTTLPVRWDECSYSLNYNKSDGLVPMMPTYLNLLNDPYPLKLEVKGYSRGHWSRFGITCFSLIGGDIMIGQTRSTFLNQNGRYFDFEVFLSHLGVLRRRRRQLPHPRYHAVDLRPGA